MESNYFYKDCLNSELQRRVRNNRSYSLRAFARALALEPGALSQFLSGKRVPSFKVALQIVKELDLSEEQRKGFINSLAKHQQARGLKRMNPVFRTLCVEPELPQVKELGADLFRTISDWYHYAILLMVEIKGFKPDPRWVASRLGISPLEAKLSLERLIGLGLLETVSGKLRRADQNITTANKERTSSDLKRRQRQILEKAIESLENDSIDIRSMTGMTMAIDPARLPQAKRLISEFNRKMSRCLESGEKKEVYELQISLFPLQKRRNT